MRWPGGGLRLFARPKEAGKASEDVVASRRAAHRFVLCDGASHGYDPRGWAQGLARAYVREPQVDAAWLAAARRRFHQRHEGRLTDRYRRAAFARGSFATLLGITLRPGRLEVTAIGDSLLFLRDAAGCRWVPEATAESLEARPLLLGSHAGTGAFGEGEAQFAAACRSIDAPESGWVGTGIAMMTDALGVWVLGEPGPRLDALFALRCADEFDALVAGATAAGAMPVDDTTLLILEPGGTLWDRTTSP